ncbi:MAG: hypothetical protein P1P76_03945 [Anaerolineales bacterium]|nr:hypothetical protein [Anaerolineales bacterium]
MQSVEHNLSYLDNCLEEMETYLLQPELFWPLSTSAGVRSEFSRLTVANVLLTLNELDAQVEDMSPGEAAQVSRLRTRWETLHTKWRTAIESKSIAEMRARLNLWKAYILDLEEQKGRQANYAQEVTQRVRFALLHKLTGDAVLTDELIERMQAVDSRALALTAPADFVWDKPLQAIYPPDEYVFLYRKPKTTY